MPGFRALDPIIVAPESLGGDWTSPDNTAAVMALYTALETVYGTSPERRVVSGYSMGAMGTWHLLAEHGNYFSAAIPVSGYRGDFSGPCAIPVYAIHSTGDQLFPADGLQALRDRLVAADCEMTLDIIDGVDHFAVGAFAENLRSAATWLQQVWSE